MIQYFINQIVDPYDNEIDAIAALLEARGFLLKKYKGQYILSDNSHKNDYSYLSEVMRENLLGEVTDKNILQFGPNATIKNAANLFLNYRQVQMDCVEFEYPGSWRTFLHQEYGMKVPVALLEPFVARYVKAVSACGVSTVRSCDGNHNGLTRLYIVPYGTANAIWHQVICTGFSNKALLWVNNCTTIRFNEDSQMALYFELNKQAAFLYENRLKLRKIRNKVSNQLVQSGITNRSDAEISAEFQKLAIKQISKVWQQNK